MNHLGTVVLETTRLKLRRFTIEDAEGMYRNWASEDEVTKFLTCGECKLFCVNPKD